MLPSPVVHCAALEAAGRKDCWRRPALKTCTEGLQKEIQEDWPRLSLHMDAARSGKLQFRFWQILLPVYCFNASMAACGKGLQRQIALQVLSEMPFPN